MRYCINLLTAALLAFGVLSAYADSETDRYMASASASSAEETREDAQQSGPKMSLARLTNYWSPCIGLLCGPNPTRSCKFNTFCRNDMDCGEFPNCPCIPHDLGNPRAGGSCQ